MRLRRWIWLGVRLAAATAAAAAAAVMTAYEVTPRPFSLESRSTAFHVATSRLLVDVTDQSTLVSIKAPRQRDLAGKGRYYLRSALALPSVRVAALRESGLPSTAAVAFLDPAVTRSRGGAAAVASDAQALLDQLPEGSTAVVGSMRSQGTIIELIARSQDPALAQTLAAGTARAFRRHVESIPAEGVAAFERVQVRILGPPKVERRAIATDPVQVAAAAVLAAVAVLLSFWLVAVARGRVLGGGAAGPARSSGQLSGQRL